MPLDKEIYDFVRATITQSYFERGEIPKNNINGEVLKLINSNAKFENTNMQQLHIMMLNPSFTDIENKIVFRSVISNTEITSESKINHKHIISKQCEGIEHYLLYLINLLTHIKETASNTNICFILQNLYVYELFTKNLMRWKLTNGKPPKHVKHLIKISLLLFEIKNLNCKINFKYVPRDVTSVYMSNNDTYKIREILQQKDNNHEINSEKEFHYSQSVTKPDVQIKHVSKDFDDVSICFDLYLDWLLSYYSHHGDIYFKYCDNPCFILSSFKIFKENMLLNPMYGVGTINYIVPRRNTFPKNTDIGHSQVYFLNFENYKSGEYAKHHKPTPIIFQDMVDYLPKFLRILIPRMDRI